MFKPNIDWLNKRPETEPVWILPELKTLIPNGKIFDTDTLFKKHGKYFTSSIAYMIAYAMELGYKRIGLYGIDMAMDSEYQYQRPCVEYYVGLARGAGIVVDIPEQSHIMSYPWVYGIEDPPETEGIITEAVCRERARELEAQLKKDTESALLHRGALQMVDWFMRQIRTAKRDAGFPELPGEISRDELHREMMNGPQTKPNKPTS
jgi:hypothetical protein